LKGGDKAQMKRLVMMALIKLCGKAILLTLMVGIVIGIIGHMNQWNSSLAYSNAFFIAGCLVIGSGGLSRLSAGEEINNFRLLYAESFREMSSSERANFIVNASSSMSTVILSLLTGMLLMVISVVVVKMF
jgi:ABC-type antimicrobial peptide transport system permease subunit